MIYLNDIFILMPEINEVDSSPKNHKNYEKLQKNKQKVMSHAASFSRDDGISEQKRKSLIEDSKTIILNAAIDSLEGNEPNFSVAIQKMDQLKDAKLGITWHESKDLGEGTKALVRDARNVTNNINKLQHDAGEKYAMQVLNEVRAAIDLLDTDAAKDENGVRINKAAKEEIKEELMNIAKHAVQNHEQLNSKSIKEINTYIVHQLEQAGIQEAGSALNFAKEVANFKDEHKHIVTLTSAENNQGKPATVIEADIMLNGLTDSQKAMYIKISTNQRGAEIGGDENLAWYNDMPKYKREMIGEVAGDIAEGNKVIPAQLLKDIPGIRNAYDKVTAVQYNEGEPVIVAESMHSGTPATKIKLKNSDLSKEKVKAAQESIVSGNLDQMHSFIPEGKTLHLNNFTSETAGNLRGENFIHKQTEKSVNENTEVTHSPVNRWRLVGGGGRDHRAFDDALKNIGNDNKFNNQDNLKSTAKYLKDGDSRLTRFASAVTFGLIKTNYQRAKQEVDGLKSSPENIKLSSTLEAAITAKKRINQTTIFSRSPNINLEVSAQMAIVDQAIRNEEGPFKGKITEETRKNHHVTISFCKSGKDRTGLAQLDLTFQAVCAELEIDPKSKGAEQIKLALVAGGHSQEMAGIQGGTTGCHSLKVNPEFSVGKTYSEFKNILGQASAKFNSSIKVVNDKDKDKAIDKVANAVKPERGQKQNSRIDPELAQVAKNVVRMQQKSEQSEKGAKSPEDSKQQNTHPQNPQKKSNRTF